MRWVVVSAWIALAVAAHGDLADDISRCEERGWALLAQAQADSTELESNDSEAVVEQATDESSAEASDSDVSSTEGDFLLDSTCPEVAQAIAERPLGQLLRAESEAWTTEDAWGVLSLEALYRGDQDALLSTQRGLAEALESLPQKPEEPISLWQRFTNWLGDWFRDNEQDTPDWLRNIRVSDAVVESLYYTVGAVIVIAAIVFVVLEVRRHRREQHNYQERRWRIQRHEDSPPQWADLSSCEPDDYAPLLFRLVVDRLQHAGQLPKRSSLTHQDIISCGAQWQQASAVTQIGRAAERSLFGGWQPNRAEREALGEVGQALLDTLDIAESQPHV